MIIVDDKLSLDVLGGQLELDGPAAITWGFHFRLLRALGDGRRWGVLSRDATRQVRALATRPPESRLRVLDPRVLTERAAELAIRHDLNLLAAELVAAAGHHRAAVHLTSRNVGRRWPEVMAAEAIALTVV